MLKFYSANPMDGKMEIESKFKQFIHQFNSPAFNEFYPTGDDPDLRCFKESLKCHRLTSPNFLDSLKKYCDEVSAAISFIKKREKENE